MCNKSDRVNVVLIRHAQSEWNRENRFTGWANPLLTRQGVKDAKLAAECLLANGCRFDMVYSSRLERAIHTTELIANHLAQKAISFNQDWRLNERHYGSLQGKDKLEAARIAGEQQVWRWRRGYYDKAEPLMITDAEHPVNDSQYADVDPARLPAVENLDETRKRVTEFWQQVIEPRISEGKRILISAHGNTLRALIMTLSKMTVKQVKGFEIPTAKPIVYQFNRQGKAINWYYLPNCVERRTA